MLILAFETSSKAASVALCEDRTLAAQYFQNRGPATGSTILPMANDLLKNTGVEISDIDVLAVSRGPGSFTGIRIGVSAVKGLCWGAEKPAIGVSTLEAAAWNGVFAPDGTIICSVTDARLGQVYNALFRLEGKIPLRLCPDREITLDALSEELSALKSDILPVGDGAALFHSQIKGSRIMPAPENIRHQCAMGVAMAAADKIPGPARDLFPVYIRPSQAERERTARLDAPDIKENT
ncbi:MAG: tRNA (adenosine(37)-N6)-threonylcarbamoyltransferase complex dimerization subunit type 1 TsaB [Oscillospiraceae bacterium]|nr:tRNA (adenosine(37)-N6)-threonylcarbamoyltransferase complex dimerization subunit type 1 TsaB [Oscillospiraceae bacterium]